ncbi:MAG: hypothetical protein ACXWM7_04225 [Parachlamydiaceae bacterium]
MGLSGSGIGGSVGSPTQLSVRELEATASVDVAKAAMRIMADTLEVSLLVVDQDVRKYQSSASRPVIAPLIKTRVATDYEQPRDESWRSLRNEMLNFMPKEFRQLFEAMLLLPKDQQNKDFILLDNTLQTAAKLLSWLAAASAPINADSPAALAAKANLLLPYIALNTSIRDSLLLFEHALSHLELVGPNDPNFDAISGYIGAFTPLVDELKVAMEQLQGPSTELLARSVLASIASKISVLADNYDRLYSGNELRLLGHTLHSIATATEALSLSQPGSAALLLTFSQALYAVKSDESALGILGNSYSTVIDAFKSGINQLTEGRLQGSNLNLYSHFATTLFVMISVLGTLNYEFISPANPSTPESVSDKNFGHGLLLDILTHSNTLSALSSLIGNASDIQGKDLKSTTSLLTTMSLLFLISASVKGHDLSSTEPLLKSQGEALKDGIATACSLVSGGLLAETLSGETVEHLNVYLKQASIALEQEDEEGFLAALDSSIELIGTSSATAAKDLNELNTTAHSLQSGLTTKGDDTHTGVHFAA